MYAFGPYLACGDKNSIGFKKVRTNLLLIAFGAPAAGLASTFADNFGGDQEGAVILPLVQRYFLSQPFLFCVGS